jgi:DNA replication ATP-dependent helicase Dna2
MGQRAIPSRISRHSYHPGEQTVKNKNLDYRVKGFRTASDSVISGEPHDFEEGEENVFSPIELSDHILNLQPNDFLLEIEYDVVPGFIRAHNLADLIHGRTIEGGGILILKRVRPDIIRVVPSNGCQRRAIQPNGAMLVVAADDRRAGLRVIDIKATGEASPAHFAELAYYGMTLAAWLNDHQQFPEDDQPQ